MGRPIHQRRWRNGSVIKNASNRHCNRSGWVVSFIFACLLFTNRGSIHPMTHIRIIGGLSASVCLCCPPNAMHFSERTIFGESLNDNDWPCQWHRRLTRRSANLDSQFRFEANRIVDSRWTIADENAKMSRESSRQQIRLVSHIPQFICKFKRIRATAA